MAPIASHAILRRGSSGNRVGWVFPALPILQREDGRSDVMRIARYQNTRYWAVYASDGTLICLCVYRKGAQEVVRRLQTKCCVSEMKTRLTSHFPACLLGVSSENQDINCETEH